ncbi:hypothetical protein FSP39_021846 [Pinctada imbricata]|uniref:Uncharacterized protein n=1 Tax=Pinctada imbricata TaxID=66713 RepID=A0AA88YLH7_PINIB|nr:hypothetical protein FSP39_021846 [Pinctada imbricata]
MAYGPINSDYGSGSNIIQCQYVQSVHGYQCPHYSLSGKSEEITFGNQRYFSNEREPRELPYGDNGLFMSRKAYDMAGGFQDLYLLEDVTLVESLWKYGHIGAAEGDPMITSARRWRKWGAFRITGLNYCIITAFHLGVHPDRLARWYYGKEKIKQY